jgi:hypothetical protein
VGGGRGGVFAGRVVDELGGVWELSKKLRAGDQSRTRNGVACAPTANESNHVIDGLELLELLPNALAGL